MEQRVNSWNNESNRVVVNFFLLPGGEEKLVFYPCSWLSEKLYIVQLTVCLQMCKNDRKPIIPPLPLF
jgi:hypothetical protein